MSMCQYDSVNKIAMVRLRCSAVFVIIISLYLKCAMSKSDDNTKTKFNTKGFSEKSETCPFSKIIEDINRIRNKTTNAENQLKNSERTKIFVSAISNFTSKGDGINSKERIEDDLISKIIASINRIRQNFTANNEKESSLHDAIIIKTPKNSNKTTANSTQHIIDDKLMEFDEHTQANANTSDNLKVNYSNRVDSESKKDSNQTTYIEIQTIEPNNTKNVTTPNFIDILKNLMPMFNSTLTKEIHNITVIERDRNRNNSYSETRNISTVIVTYCDNNTTTANTNNYENETLLVFNNATEDQKDYLDVDDYLSPVTDFDYQNYNSNVNLTEDEKKDILEAADYGVQRMYELYSIMEPKLYSMGLWLDESEPGRYLAAFNAPAELASRYARYGYATLQAAARLRQLTRGGASDDEEAEQRQAEPQNQFPGAGALRDSSLLAHCPLRSAPACPPASKRYRTHDGTCNNLHRPRWGSTMTPVQRFLLPCYSDDLQAPRRSIFGKPLPSAREISSLVHEDQNVESSTVTHLLMQWGQFIDHDITSSSQSRGFNGSVPRCCKNGGRDFMPKEFMHPECMPIAVPPSDPFYGRRGVRCLEFIRSSPAPRDDCALGWREQLNQVSAYIDGSPLYGSSARQSDRLRLFRNGMLQFGRAAGGGSRNELCRGGALSATCFKSGDGRVNEHPGLVAAHIVWVKQHNRMAQELSRLNQHWSDEKTYQETRKIIGAMLQHITYNEFLPIVLGSEVMRLFDLDPQRKGYYRDHDPKTNPSPASSFGSAAFRFGHSLVQPSMVRFDRFHRPIDNNVSLHEEPSNPSNIWSIGAVDRLLLGMVNQPVQKRDEFITEELTNHLFQTPQFDFGMDLAAINIQRGRDHGLPSYTAWREPCGLTPIRNFEDLFRIMSTRVARKLESLYRHVDDIDLFTGGMAERPVVGGMVGPTFACIIAQQFSNLRKGDRFWYENGGFESSFTPAQLQQIRRITLAQVLCHTLDHMDTIQEFAFLSPDSDNERISCGDGIMNTFNLSPWTEIDNSERDFINDINKSNELNKRPITENSTTKPTKNDEDMTQKVTHKKPPAVVFTKPQNVKHKNSTKTTNKHKLNSTTKPTAASITKATTHIIDDKLDFRNKSRRYNDKPDRYYQTRPTEDYEYDDEPLAQQTVVVNNLPYRRPHRPVIAVTENIDKYTYLINYVPRPTQSWRQTTRNYNDRDVVKVTYQTYDDTYRRPNRPYYNKYHDRYDYKNRDNANSDDNKNLDSLNEESQKSDILQLNLDKNGNEKQNKHNDYSNRPSDYQPKNEPDDDYHSKNRPDQNYQTKNEPESGSSNIGLDPDILTKGVLNNNYNDRNRPNLNYRSNNRHHFIGDTGDRPYSIHQNRNRNKLGNKNETTVDLEYIYNYHNKNIFDTEYQDRNNDFKTNSGLDNITTNKTKINHDHNMKVVHDNKTINKLIYDFQNKDRPNAKDETKNKSDDFKTLTELDVDYQNSNNKSQNDYEKQVLDKQTIKQDYSLASVQSNNKDESTDYTTAPTLRLNDGNRDRYVTTTDKYKLVTFRYVGTYKGHDITTHDDRTDKLNKDNSKFSKDFSTYRPKLEDLASDDDDSISDKLSTFFHYDTATRPYNVHRPTRRDDSDGTIPNETNMKTKYYYIKNVLYRYPDEKVTELDDKTYDDAQERSSIDKMTIIEEGESKAIPVKRPLVSAAKTPSVAFQVEPSENSSSQWAVYEELDIPDSPRRARPPSRGDPHELDELPKPMNFSNMKRRKPSRL